MSKGPFFTDRIEFYRLDSLVDLFTTGNVNLITDDIVKGSTIFPVQVILEIVNVIGTPSVSAAVIVDDGTDAHNIIASTSLASPVEGQAFYLRPTANTIAYAVKPGDTLRLRKAALGVGQATTFRARASNVATLTTAAPHGAVAGDVITVASVGGTGYNGRVTVLSAPTTTTFTYANTGANESSAADTAGRVGAFDVKVYTHVFRGFNE